MRFITPIRFLITLLFAIVVPLTPVYSDLFPYPPKTLKVLIVCGHSVDCPRAIKIFDNANAYLEKVTNVRLEIKAIVSMPEEMTGLAEWRLNKWTFATRKDREDYKVDATLVFVEPYPLMGYIDFETENVLGIAGVGCLGNNDCVGLVKIVGNDEIATRITLHEMGHMYGAVHTDGLGIMAADAQQVQYMCCFAQQSIYQMQYYIYKNL